MYHYHYLDALSAKADGIWTKAFQKTENMGKADAILVRSAPMQTLPLPENLLAIGRAGAGVNNIPLKKCSDAGIVVFNTPGANADSVAELTLCAMLLGCRDVLGGIEWVKANAKIDNMAKAVEKEKSRFAGVQLRDRSIGIIGLGAVGRRVAGLCSAMGAVVYGFDPYFPGTVDGRIARVETVDAIYDRCDIISLHVPLTDATSRMIKEETIAKMKNGVCLVNMARGELVDEDAMASALAAGKVKVYITDFPNYKTAGMPGCVAIPHLGASTREAEENCAGMAVAQVVDYLENGNISNSVNFPDCHMGACSAAGRIVILHRNIPNSLGQFTAAVAAEGINIAALLNKSKADLAVTMLDLDCAAPQCLADRISGMAGVLRVRPI